MKKGKTERIEERKSERNKDGKMEKNEKREKERRKEKIIRKDRYKDLNLIFIQIYLLRNVLYFFILLMK